jgi:hypothetical protein
MREKHFSSVAEQLLRAGIAPAHVRRLVTELQSHYESLFEDERARGQPREVAQELARRKLGADEEIVKRVLEDPALKSWGARWPFSFCSLAPVLAWAASSVALIAALALAVQVSGYMNPAGTTGTAAVPVWLRQGTELFRWLLIYGLPVLWAGLFARYAATRRLRSLWPLIGILVIAVLGATTNFSIDWPHTGVRGQMSAGLGFGTHLAALATFGARALSALVLGVAVYYLMGARRLIEDRRTQPTD